MQPARPTQGPGRAPGSFSPLPGNNSAGAPDLSRPRLRRIETSSSDDSGAAPPLTVPKSRNHPGAQQSGSPATPIYASFTAHSNGSTSSLQNFSRPTLSTAISAARSVAGTHSPSDTIPRNGPSPLTLPPTNATSSSTSGFSGRLGHSRKHSQSAGLFEPTLPSTSTSGLSQIGLSQIGFGQPSPKMTPSPHREMSASQIAAQAAVMQHQSQLQQQQQAQLQQVHAQAHQQQHNRQRSQTVPATAAEYEIPTAQNKRGSGGPLSPPVLSLTEASVPRDNVFQSQTYHNGLPGNHNLAAATAANIVFPRSGQSSPGLPSSAPPMAPPPPPPKPEKSKVKLFSRPGKISIKGDPKDKPLPSPAKIGHAFSNLQRGNFSTTSLDSSAQSFYSLANSSTATIRPLDAPPLPEKDGKDKEKKHHFLSRQKHKLKDDYHLPLSSASSNSRPSDPNAPSSLYSFNLPQSPGPNSTSFKSGLDLRHGGRALRDKKKEEKGVFDDAASAYNMGGEWPGPSSVNSGSGPLASTFYLNEPFDSTKYGLHNMTVDDAWPFLKAKLLVIFEAEDLRLPVEDLNRIVTMHIQYCLARRSPNIIVEDLRELLSTGFSSLDQSLRKTPEDRLIPSLVELWIFTFTGILPYMQAVFLPLDMEFAGHGPLMTPEQARDFWGGIPARRPSVDTTAAQTSGQSVTVSPASAVLEVRRVVLLAFRDIVILPRYETLKAMFSRLSLEFLPQSLASMALASPVPIPSPNFYGQSGQYQQMLSTSPADSQASFGLSGVPGSFSYGARPGTAMSLDPSLASYNSTTTTLLGDASGSGNRSRAISNVSFGSDNTNSTRPFTPGSLHALGGGSGSNLSTAAVGGPNNAANNANSNGSMRDQNVEDSKQVTEMVGRMLQCMSVLASVSVGGSSSDEGNRMVEELNKLLKLNWLGRGRTGRNRRGIVGGRVKRAGGMSGMVAWNTMMPPPPLPSNPSSLSLAHHDAAVREVPTEG
ncbi:HbrB-like-domain-containing protein [Apodospora peruviana]|uniref:HbrB-like-domain-containing protein n=1 Tax=Apodospora peruviana TaxID=516989 RepID=A0AAE0HZQ7_9PEZI|nr:HbrB-like-domain-containing protein [Apodospora peruviana]